MWSFSQTPFCKKCKPPYDRFTYNEMGEVVAYYKYIPAKEIRCDENGFELKDSTDGRWGAYQQGASGSPLPPPLLQEILVKGVVVVKKKRVHPKSICSKCGAICDARSVVCKDCYRLITIERNRHPSLATRMAMRIASIKMKKATPRSYLKYYGSSLFLEPQISRP